ncbi:acid protease [Morchella conica CCBAS932]|uniref:Acid protease n=1 Tax=Morchella conica CCBAS932 TaxID=1392247 RepID=A0A3N4L7F0_9PEZI|nr:acid protease [Morchella conica CCBAS932]
MRIPSTILPRATTQANSTISVDFVHPTLEMEDLYLLPLTVSKPSVSFRTMLSNRLTTSWFPLAEACNNTGPDDTKPWYKFLENCYENQLLDPSKSTTITQTPNGAFSVPSTSERADQWGEFYQGSGGTGTDTMTIAGVDIPDLELNFATGINSSHAHVGLAKGSTLLDKMVEQKLINARAFSLFVGSDVRYLQNWDPNAKDANYPGSIVFGGLDFAKQSQTFIRGDLDTDGIPQLDVTGINVHAEHAVYDIMGGLGVGTYDAEIDVSSPWIYVPQVAAEAIRAKRDNDWNSSGDIVSNPVHLGNISMTVKVKGVGNGGASEVNITFPESIWGWDRSYYTVPQVTKDKYFPFLINKSNSRARVILGRPFLKGFGSSPVGNQLRQQRIPSRPRQLLLQLPNQTLQSRRRRRQRQTRILPQPNRRRDRNPCNGNRHQPDVDRYNHFRPRQPQQHLPRRLILLRLQHPHRCHRRRRRRWSPRPPCNRRPHLPVYEAGQEEVVGREQGKCPVHAVNGRAESRRDGRRCRCPPPPGAAAGVLQGGAPG